MIRNKPEESWHIGPGPAGTMRQGSSPCAPTNSRARGMKLRAVIDGDRPRAGTSRRAAVHTMRLVAGRQRDADAFLLELLANPLEALVSGERDRARIAVALHLPG